jgi:hypothetical protein
VADEFVDLYETLDLPMDTDRNTVRKRINELYIEAQRNLDHRNFQTRVKYQELFEITLPQARYILLDEGRRDQYDALVRSTRAPKGQMTGDAQASAPAASAPQTGFQLEDAIPGQTPTIEPIPSSTVPEITPEQRDEQWQKWKSGLAEVLEREAGEEIRQKTKPIISSSSTTPTESAPKKESKARPVIKFDFGDDEDNQNAEGSSDEPQLDKKEVERRRTEHRRDLTKDILVGEGIKGMAIGAAIVAIPGVIAMVVFMSHFYPRGKAAGLPVPEGAAWLIWLVVLGAAGFFTSRNVSKSMRKKRAMDLGKLPYEEIVRISGRSV